MAALDPTLLILLVLAGLGIISHNMTVTLAILTLIAVRITPLNQFFPGIEKYGLTIGILILTIGVMTPIASGKSVPAKCCTPLSSGNRSWLLWLGSQFPGSVGGAYH